ncbi:hypothetical protein ACFVW1_41875 [Streptomyces olivochromogenes]|uniref:hypothetical protein n=1 Tax=Streptomyces olivochromogenes TaxID=1963 RepID=UPI0036D82780
MAAVYTLVMLGGTLPIPLYALRAPRMGFGPFATTLIFAVYASGTVLALMAFASLSDRAGRRPLLAASVLAGAEHTRRVSTVSTAANMGGLGLGTVVAGLFGQCGANPTHLVFWAYLASLIPAFLAVIVTPETVTARQAPCDISAPPDHSRPAGSADRLPAGRHSRSRRLRGQRTVLVVGSFLPP